MVPVRTGYVTIFQDFSHFIHTIELDDYHQNILTMNTSITQIENTSYNTVGLTLRTQFREMERIFQLIMAITRNRRGLIHLFGTGINY